MHLQCLVCLILHGSLTEKHIFTIGIKEKLSQVFSIVRSVSLLKNSVVSQTSAKSQLSLSSDHAPIVVTGVFVSSHSARGQGHIRAHGTHLVDILSRSAARHFSYMAPLGLVYRTTSAVIVTWKANYDLSCCECIRLCLDL